ncbi:amidase [Sulfitobacter mediterraneus]|uniref:amidase n=1 Tax=Sulfitobacter mediterraneus TaxID=83219 RepID=UPI001931F5DA|nr:amidase family protein [Sulfitobacter mediterraneus]MBM1632675.1 amidase [Sulfitobacter mediterraneus]MBM1641191.1 amidase [Sulfitobacter mediterraneus]MBM1644540.1 amidase [Sulfitobacter mediterraneus]MBM1649311.1 amidase [Sulfitobacter mediterraneus]MBM1653332.1 amidase [Sulfitobacter mediterraneus]
MQDWLMMTAADLGRGIAEGQIDPVALCQTYLDAIDAHPLRDRIYARVTADRALAEAQAASERAKSGHRLSALDGVPVSWKDLFDTAGVATEAGSKLLEGRVPDRDAVVLQNATAAGLVCLGKTHMSELAFSGLGHNPSTATPPSVNDPDGVSGGSSSGAAASVAFGLAAAGIGSDTGGSVRIPAAWNDLVGLKTTSDRLTLEGVVPLALRFDTIGPLCRSVEDASLLLAALEGTKAADLHHADIEGRRFARLTTVAMDDLREAPAAAYADALARLEAAGAIIEDIDVPEVNEVMPLSGCLYTAEAYGLWRDVIEANPEKMFSEILERFLLGKGFSGPDYVAAWATLHAAREGFYAATAGFDAVLLPTAPILPPNLARLTQDHDYYVSENLMALRNTRIGNLMGGCALTLPTGTPSCGLMMMAPPNHEERLLRLGAAVEEALG